MISCSHWGMFSVDVLLEAALKEFEHKYGKTFRAMARVRGA